MKITLDISTATLARVTAYQLNSGNVEEVKGLVSCKAAIEYLVQGFIAGASYAHVREGETALSDISLSTLEKHLEQFE